MRCSVENCKNDTQRTTKTHGITFHKFPKDTDLRNSWIEALGLSDWELRDGSVVCSEHFQQDAFYETSRGMKRLKSRAIPLPVDISCEDLEAPAALLVCRICLSMDVKMYHLSEYNLRLIYEQVTGASISTDDKLPQMLCWECTARLSSANTFRSKALRTRGILMKKLNVNRYITIRDVKSISRAYNQLQSTLGEKNYGVNDCDLHIKENDVVKIETYNDSDVFNDDFHVNDNDDFDDVKLVEIDIKDEESSEIFFEESPIFDTDDSDDSDDIDDNDDIDDIDDNDDSDNNDDRDHIDDSTSSDDYMEKSKVKAKRIKIEKKGKKREERDDESPSAIMDKYKRAGIIRKKPSTGLDESLFTITAMTYEEQIEEVESRQELSTYQLAPYKCTSCYRGFKQLDEYNNHIVRHSEKIGPFECFICKTRFKSAKSLRHHLTSQHSEKFECNECPFVTRNRCVARDHQKWHAGEQYECPHCPSVFNKQSTCKTHIRLKHVCDVVCELCGYTFINDKGVDIHKLRKHRLDNDVSLDGPYCDACDVRFATKAAFDRHLKLSSRHITDDDPTRLNNSCQNINKARTGRVARSFEKRPAIRAPSPAPSLHGGGAPVTCEQCGLELSDLRQYAKHFRSAHPDKNRTKFGVTAPCMCELCGRVLMSMALLKDHMWVHTGKKRFSCDQCDKSFTQKTNLQVHMGVHSGARRLHECPTCGKGFSYDNNLKRHMVIHTGLKPFACDTCGKAFATAGELRAHVAHVHLKKPWPKRARGRAHSHTRATQMAKN